VVPGFLGSIGKVLGTMSSAGNCNQFTCINLYECSGRVGGWADRGITRWDPFFFPGGTCGGRFGRHDGRRKRTGQ